MKIFIWERVDRLTTSYHSEGGCAVIANDLVEARSLLPEECGAQNSYPDYEYEIFSKESKVFIFPDSGCC